MSIESAKILWVDSLILLKMYPIEYDNAPEWLKKKIDEFDELMETLDKSEKYRKSNMPHLKRLGIAYTIRMQRLLNFIVDNDLEKIDYISSLMPKITDADIIVSYWYGNRTHYGIVWNKKLGIEIGEIYVDPIEEWRVVNSKPKKI